MWNIKDGDYMYKFTNTTTKENFLKSIEWNGKEIKPIEAYGKDQKHGMLLISLGMNGIFFLLEMWMNIQFLMFLIIRVINLLK